MMDKENVRDLRLELVMQKRQTEQMWFKHYLLTTGIEYTNGCNKVIIQPINNRNLTIRIYPDFPATQKNVYFYAAINQDSVYIQDLVGNGESSRLQGKYFGTILVNLAIQVFRLFVATDAQVCGEVNNTGDEDLETGSAIRHHFWARFGFKLVDPEQYNTPMKATLGDLEILDRGVINGSLPSTLNLSEFYSPLNRPVIPEKLWKTLLELDVNDFLLDGFEDIQDKPFSPDIATWLESWLFSSRRDSDCSTTRERHLNEVDKKKQAINELEHTHAGFIWRIYEPLSEIDTTLQNEAFDELSRASNAKHLRRNDYLIYANLLELLKNKLIKGYRKPEDPISIEQDFLFGNLDYGLDIHTLKSFAQVLDKKHLIQHLNRLLKRYPHNNLVITGGNTLASELSIIIPTLVSDIAQIELYARDEPYREMNELHLKVYLSEGVLDIRPPLCLRNENRAADLARSLESLLRCGLTDRTFISFRNLDGCPEKYYLHRTPRAFLMDVFALLGSKSRWVTDTDLGELEALILTSLKSTG